MTDLAAADANDDVRIDDLSGSDDLLEVILGNDDGGPDPGLEFRDCLPLSEVEALDISYVELGKTASGLLTTPDEFRTAFGSDVPLIDFARRWVVVLEGSSGGPLVKLSSVAFYYCPHDDKLRFELKELAPGADCATAFGRMEPRAAFAFAIPAQASSRQVLAGAERR